MGGGTFTEYDGGLGVHPTLESYEFPPVHV